MKREGICIFCEKFSELVPGWYAVGIDICHPCNRKRQELAVDRAKQSQTEAKT